MAVGPRPDGVRAGATPGFPPRTIRFEPGFAVPCPPDLLFFRRYGPAFAVSATSKDLRTSRQGYTCHRL
jgi:hypothetical protein